MCYQTSQKLQCKRTEVELGLTTVQGNQVFSILLLFCTFQQKQRSFSSEFYENYGRLEYSTSTDIFFFVLWTACFVQKLCERNVRCLLSADATRGINRVKYLKLTKKPPFISNILNGSYSTNKHRRPARHLKSFWHSINKQHEQHGISYPLQGYRKDEKSLKQT